MGATSGCEHLALCSRAMPLPRIETARLVLRDWTAADFPPFCAINADPDVTRFLPTTASRDESAAAFARIRKHIETHSYGIWVLEERAGRKHIGSLGLMVPRFEAHFTPCVEIGWRLAKSHWNKGFATEAAKAVVQHAFDVLQLKEIVSFTVPDNVPSRRVMEKVGFRFDTEFDHPNFADDHPLRRHVLYRLGAADPRP